MTDKIKQAQEASLITLKDLQANGHLSWYEYQTITRALADAERMKTELKNVTDLFALENEGSNERFERLGDMFRRDTGYLRPGKDYGMCGAQPPENLNEIYDEWFKEKVTNARKCLEEVGK